MHLYNSIQLDDLEFEVYLIAPYYIFAKNNNHKKFLNEFLTYFKQYDFEMTVESNKDELPEKYEDVRQTCKDSIRLLSMCLKKESADPIGFGSIVKFMFNHDLKSLKNIESVTQKKLEPLRSTLEKIDPLSRTLKKKFQTMLHSDDELQGEVRRQCEGYLFVIQKKGNILMTMTAWTSPTGSYQEHALIMKNFYNGMIMRQPPPVKLSILMHSFAAYYLDKPIIYCNPLPKMRDILKHDIPSKYNVNMKQVRKGHDQKVNFNPCIMFGTTIKIDNRKSDLKQIFIDYYKQAEIRSINSIPTQKKYTFVSFEKRLAERKAEEAYNSRLYLGFQPIKS
jgi:hypothetical protein